jgi:hypothetical protein
VRRTMRSGLGKLGVRPDVAERCIGHHRGLSVEATYDRYRYAPEIAASLALWAALVVAVVEGRAAAVVPLKGENCASGLSPQQRETSNCPASSPKERVYAHVSAVVGMANAPSGGMAADRVARGRDGAEQILALDIAKQHRFHSPSSILPRRAGASNAIIRKSQDCA